VSEHYTNELVLLSKFKDKKLNFFPDSKNLEDDDNFKIKFGIDFGKKSGFIRIGDPVICINGAGSNKKIFWIQ
jgi:hypothetical protein